MRKALATVVGLATVAALVIFGPQPVKLADTQTGNPQLATFLAENSPRGAHNVTAFVLDGDQPVFAGLGANEHTEVEIGSVTKTFTAELLRQAVEKGTVRLDTKVSDIIDTRGAPIGSATLEQLANHEAGLPRNPGLDTLSLFIERNPYGSVTREDIFKMALKADLKGQGERNYSNLGVALLGQLIAEKDGRSWEEMVQQDIFDPLGMTSTYVASVGKAADAPHGLNGRGREAANWEMDGYAPCGAIRSTAFDMAKFALHVRSVGVPSYAWKHDDYGASHNGSTGGFRTMLVFDPTGQRAAFVNNNSTTRMDELGKEMLKWQQ
ncbi:D-alanyl-D-alanine-carboxypeptidase/endopeptidase AmpH precursor [Corynebacterium kalinowskii]|uniref:D-alanyl-D-alanine-carboxypeptidase/endopeptidase AmpH n=1 Tax=Corynebacterium kalinowskii TaxID=2675216 RepID=A0A6B8W2E4_9CORY|nr:serine hydrolase domain-containing protein [Corynebacterium kalinowskii]QGU01808.1 D-alanyl-D-alanine-carboxypeptidase/endopeptidase AmpH precursor [Corynebacterium kalinowskii]